MAESHKATQGAEDYGYVVSGSKASPGEFVGADDLRARLAADDADDDKAVESHARVNAEEVVPVKKKPKVKKPKPTGFEEYHADAPLTPAEHAEEKELYDRSIPFATRILTAIRRFERRRKLNPEMRDVFLTYLSYGGVTVGPNMFQGGNKKADLEGMDKDELAETTAQTSLTDDKDNTGKDTSAWVVDFEGTMKGFLSRRAPYYYGFETRAQVDTITKVLTNFMNYLLHHDVCPEYATDVLAARTICNIANAEIWACAEAQRWLPGDFNVACSTLFNGSYSRLYDGTMTWMPDESGFKGFVGMDCDVAREVVKFAVAGAAREEVYQAWYEMATEDTIETVEVHEAAGFEITAIDKVDEETKAFYREQSTEYRPVGKIRAKPWTNPEGPPEDLTLEEKEALQKETRNKKSGGSSGDNGNSTKPIYEFFIEEVVLQHLFVGMKIQATIRKLNCGVWFFDEVLRAFCSFDTYLCNELMVGWKEPRAIDRATAKLGDNLEGGEQAER